jgi:hypothetical protein
LRLDGQQELINSGQFLAILLQCSVINIDGHNLLYWAWTERSPVYIYSIYITRDVTYLLPWHVVPSVLSAIWSNFRTEHIHLKCIRWLSWWSLQSFRLPRMRQ